MKGFLGKHGSEWELIVFWINWIYYNYTTETKIDNS